MGRTLLTAIIAVTLLVPGKVQALENEDLLALVAMPLAVAAVSEMTDIPTGELIDVVTLLNDAAVPPSQFIEVVRYVPVALVAPDTEPDFVEFVRDRSEEGLRGTQLVTSIAQQLRVYGMPDVDLAVTRLRTMDVTEDTFVPSPVRKRLAEVRTSHPHGGPPGQLKKAAGVQTGAEIVHRDRAADDDEAVSRRVIARSVEHRDDDRKVRPRKAVAHDDHGHQGNGKGHGKGHGNGGGHGKGKGKG
jgi:hypothetical protein